MSSNTSPLPLAESTSHNIPGSYNNQLTNQENERKSIHFPQIPWSARQGIAT